MSQETFATFLGALSAGSTPAGTETLPALQGGATKGFTVAQIVLYLANHSVSLSATQIWQVLNNLGITNQGTSWKVTQPDGSPAYIPLQTTP
jgi:hypothetical protein